MKDQVLPSKESSAFKTVLKLYDEKQYKKAIKTAEGILKKFPNNGETIAMKGLAQYHYYDKPMFFNEKLRDEGFNLVKDGLRKNVRSHVCWHVFGIVQKAKGMYKEATKAYLGALRIQPANSQILHDTAVLQMRIRDIQGLLKTRHQILNLQGTRKSSWVGFLIAHYLAKNYNMTQAIIDAYITTIGEGTTDTANRYLKSEALLFKARVLLESGDKEGCINFLTSDQIKSITDQYAIKKLLSSLYLEKGQYDEAKSLFLELLTRNMDNLDHHFGYFATVTKSTTIQQFKDSGRNQYDIFSIVHLFDASVKQELIATYRGYKAKKEYTKNWTVDIILLALLEGDDFKQLSEEIIKRNLVKGVPTLFKFFETFYSFNHDSVGAYDATLTGDIVVSGKRIQKPDALAKQAASKKAILGEIITHFVTSLAASKTFSSSDKDIQSPDVWVWAEFFRIQHIYYVEGYEKSLLALDELMKKLPTLIPLYLFKAKVLDSCGKHLEAAFCLNEARILDLQDRYINTVCSQGLLRCGLVSSYFNSTVDYSNELSLKLVKQSAYGEDVVSLFSRHEGDGRTNLFEMEVVWYSEAIAAAAERLLLSSIVKGKSPQIITKELAFAIKYNKEVVHHFQQYEDAQSDFHSYCLRIGGLSCYADFLDHIGNVRVDKRFFTACKRLLRLFYFLEDNSDFFLDDEERIKELEIKAKSSDIPSAEKKKLKQEINKLKKALKNKKPDVEEIIPQAQHKKGRRRKQLADKDPTGLIQFKQIKTSLTEECNKVIELLADNCETDVNSCILLANHSIRRGKLLLALKYLQIGLKASSSLPYIHPQIVCIVLFVLALVQGKSLVLYSIGLKSKRVDVSPNPAVKKVVLKVISDILGDTSTDIAKHIDNYERQMLSQQLCNTGRTLYESSLLLCKFSVGLLDESTFIRKVETVLLNKRNAESSYFLLKLLVQTSTDNSEIQRLAKLALQRDDASDVSTFL